MPGITIASGLGGVVGSHVDSTANRLVFVEYSGRISSVDLATNATSVLGSGYTEPEDVVLTADGSTAYVSERAGNLLKVDLANADRANASVITSGLVAPSQIALFEDQGLAWIVEYDASGRLVEVDLGSGSQTVLVSGLDHAVGLVARHDRSLALISEQGAGIGRILSLAFPGGTATLLADGLSSPFFLRWSDAGESTAFFTERDPANRVSIVEGVNPPAARRLVLIGASFRPSSVGGGRGQQLARMRGWRHYVVRRLGGLSGHRIDGRHRPALHRRICPRSC